MMKTKITAIFFALSVLVQLSVPASMIFTSEKTLAKGRAFRFKTAPVDPYDAFRGKYVTLSFKAGFIDSSEKSRIVDTAIEKLSYGKMVYALLEDDNNGFARIARLQRKRPNNGFFVRVKVNDLARNGIDITFSFTKFFLEEGKAKQAEDLYRQQNRTGKLDSYAIVRVGSNGHAVIEDLVLGGIPVRDALR